MQDLKTTLKGLFISLALISAVGLLAITTYATILYPPTSLVLMLISAGSILALKYLGKKNIDFYNRNILPSLSIFFFGLFGFIFMIVLHNPLIGLYLVLIPLVLIFGLFITAKKKHIDLLGDLNE